MLTGSQTSKSILGLCPPYADLARAFLARIVVERTDAIGL
jgi:hypothetical protein